MPGVNMIVCCKEVPDPEAPPASYKVDPANKKVIPAPGVKHLIGQYDEFAMEAALRIKDQVGGKITALSLGRGFVMDVIKKTMSVGGDELILLDDAAFEQCDTCATAQALAMAIKKIGEYDLIFCGRQDSDWGYMQIPLGIAEILGIPAIHIAKKVEVIDGKARIERVAGDITEVIEVGLPALVTVTSELGNLRYPALKGIMAAAKKKPTVWGPADIGVDASQIGAMCRCKTVSLFQPVKESKCEIIEADSPAEAAVKLALRLREEKLI